MIPAGLPSGSMRLRFGALILLISLAISAAWVWSGSFIMSNADGSFETGLGGMTIQGDVRLVANVGILLPTQGTQAALLTSEPDGGATPNDADMSVLRIDHVTIAANFTQLRIDYNFFTNEHPSDLANDRFAVDLVLVESSGEETLLEIDTFTPLFPAPLTPFARQTGFRTLVADVSAHAGSGETVALELRLTDVGDGRLDSAVLVDNMQFASADEPEAIANVEYLIIQPGEVFIFDGFASPDANGDITAYQWDFGDGIGAFGPIAEHTYAAPGLYQATLTVTDRDGHQQTDTFLVAVGEVSASPSITSTPPRLVPQGGVYRYDVEAEDADIATGDALTYSLVQSPSGMTMDSQTGLIEWRPTSEAPRQAPVTVAVQDRVGQRDTQSFTIVVDAEAFVVAANDSGEVFVASSMGDGTFGPLAFIAKLGFFSLGGVAQADFDGDGDFDIVTGHAVDPQLFLYYIENQGAQFASPVLIGTVGDSVTPGGQRIHDLAAADVNADGLMDFAVNGRSQTAWLFQRNGALVFGQTTFWETDFETDAGGWGTPQCNTDLALDGTTANSGTQSMRVFATGTNSCMSVRITPGNWDLSQGPVLTFAYRVPPGAPVGLLVDVASFGQLFLGGSPAASGGTRPSVPAVHFIDDGNWHTATIDLPQAIRQQWPTAARVDYLEWRTESNASAGTEFWFDDVKVTRRTLESGFAVSTLPVTGGGGRGLDAADINGDGHIDFVRGATTSGQLQLYEGDGTGHFTATQIANIGSNPNGVALADFDSDGVIDIISNNNYNTIPVFLKGNGDGTFQAAQQVPSLHVSDDSAYSAFDFNLDGMVDIVLTARSTHQVQYFPGQGDATFGTPVIVGSINRTGLGIAAPFGRTLGQPFGSIAVDQTDISEGDTVAFDASGSYDDGTIVDYAWDFGDGTTAIGPTVNHPFTGEGIYIITLTITDDTGKVERQGIPVTVRGNPPVAHPGGPYVLGELDAFGGRWALQLDGSGSTDAESSVVGYAWDFDASDGITVNSTEIRPHHVYTAVGTYTVTLTVFDAVTQSHTTTTTVTVNAGASPVAQVTGPSVVDETAASLGTWALRADLRATTDDAGVMKYLVDWGDGTSTTIDALRETFEDNETTTHPAWTGNGGTWDVIGGELHQTDVSSGWKWLQDLSTAYRDFVLEFDFEGVSSGGQMGIAFRHVNTDANRATFRLWSDDDEDTWRLLDWDRNTEIAAGGTGWEPGVRYHLRLVVAGRSIQLFVTPEGGAETLQLEASSLQHPVGGIALMANGQHLIYDNITVTPMEDSLQPMHVYTAAGDYTVTTTVTDAALQTGTASFNTQIQVNDPPLADAGGPYVITEADAFGGRWTFGADASASTDDHGVQRYTVDFGDGGQYTTGFSSHVSGSYFAAGTHLYGYLTPVARRPRLQATEDQTEVEVVDLVTQTALATKTLNRFERWILPTTTTTDFITIKATKPIIALEGNTSSAFSNHTTFIPSLGDTPVGHEFLFLSPRGENITVYAFEDTAVQISHINGTVLAEHTLRANTYWQPTQLNQFDVRVLSSGRIAIQTVNSTGYTTVPANTGKSVGQQFMFATVEGTSGAYSVIAYEPAEIEVFDLDTGVSLHTQALNAGEVAFQAGLDDRRLHLVSTGDVEVWAGGTRGGTATEDLGDDISVTAGRGGMEFYVHTLKEGFVIFAPNAATHIDIGDGALVTTLPRDGFLQVAPSDLPGGIGVYHLTASQPIVVQSLGRASGFSTVGTYLGGVSTRHRYDAVGTYPLTVTATDRAGQTHTVQTTVTVQAGDPPVAQIVATAMVDENDAAAGQWPVPFDASGSTDDHGIFSYTWDFGDGHTGTGINPTHLYKAPGEYTVTLTVTDHAGQPTTETFTVVIAANQPPVAVSGGPYLFGEEAARFGIWTVTVDAGNATDDVGIFDYEWIFDQDLREPFTGTTLDTNKWIAGVNTTQNDRITIEGVAIFGSWGSRYLFSTENVELAANHVFQARIRPVNTGFSGLSQWGFKNDDPADFQDDAMPYAISFNQGSVYAYEYGRLKIGGTTFTYTPDQSYDIRITLKTVGAIYDVKPATSALWTRLYESETPADTPLKMGGMVYVGTFEIDDIRLAERYFTPQVTRTYTVPGIHPITLNVRDHSLQTATASTTLTVAKNDPPVARPGGPYTIEEGHFVRFVDNASTDDHHIAQYVWDFGDGTTSNERAPIHYYTTPGTFDISLTVTDHVLQSHTATTTTGFSRVSLVDVSGVIGDWQTLELTGIAEADVTNPDAVPVGPFNLVFFEDTSGNGRFDAGLDTVLATAAHGGVAAAETVRISAPISGTVRFRDAPILTFVDTGDAQGALNRRHYGRSNGTCTFTPPIGTFNPVLEWKWPNAMNPSPITASALATPAVADLNGDGIPEVIFANSFTIGGHLSFGSVGELRAIDGRDGREIFALDNPDHWVSSAGHLTVGDIDRDGRPEIVAIGRPAYRRHRNDLSFVSEGRDTVVVFEHDGTFKWESPVPFFPSRNGPVIADLDGDFYPEIIIENRVINHDGTLRWQGTGGRGDNWRGGMPIVADLDLTGDAEVIAGHTAYRSDGTIYWENTNLTDGFNAVGNFDADTFPEVVLVTQGQLYLLEHDGTVIWGPVALPGGGLGGPPTIADVDGDGEPEIGVAAEVAYAVFEADGTLKWSQTIQDVSSNVTGSSTFDFEGDGQVEIVYRDEEYLRIYRGTDGTVLWETESPSSTSYELPVIADVDADGNAEIVIVTNGHTGPGPGIQVYGDASDSWVPARQIWNQHAYHVTNVNDDATIPHREAPSWLGQNNYRTNVRTTGSVLSSSDLTAGFLRIEPSGQAFDLTARIGNAGLLGAPAGIAIAFYDGDPRTGGLLLGTATTVQPLVPGQFEDVSVTIATDTAQHIWVAADDDGGQAGAHNECREDNNLHDSGLQVVTNQVPVAEAGGPYSGVEGIELSLDGTGSSDPDGDALSFVWDLNNDGSFDDATGANPPVSLLDEGTFTVALQVSDGQETATDTATITVINANPVVTSGADQAAAEGDEVSLSGVSFSDSGSLDTHTATVDWGDGTVTPATVTEADGAGTIAASHLYPDNGTFTVTVTVTDDDGGVGSDTLIVAVTNAVPIVAAGVDQSVTEGTAVAFAGAFSDPGVDTHSIIWDFGDGGTSTGTLTPTHLFDQNGTFTVTLTITDDDGGVGTDTLAVTVSNVAPVVDAIADQAIDEGSEFTLAATFSDPGHDTQTVVINWGDGSPTETQLIAPGAGGHISAPHIYADDGTFTVTVTVTDESGGTDTQTFTVTVNNVVPVAEAGVDQTASEGSPLSFTGSFTDSGNDAHSIRWDFGDGTVVTDTLTPTHTYEQDGIFTITFTVTDDDGDVGTDTLTVTVTNVAPAVDAIADQAVDDGSAFTLVATFSDPGHDTQTVVIDWGDGASDTQTVSPEAGGNISALHTYADDGVFTVMLTVTDESGGTDTQTFAVTVNNVVPVAEAGGNQTADEGTAVSFTGSFTDPGTDTHTIRWDFGDGTALTDLLNPTHVYIQDGTFIVTLTITDDDGAVGTDTLTVTVNNVSPMIDTIADQTVADGSELMFSATFTDPGQDTQTVVIDWGDGASDTQTVSPEAGGNISALHTYADDGVFTVMLTVTDESRGMATQSFTVTVDNVVPLAEAGSSQTVAEGSPVTFSGSFTDPGTDAHTIRWDFGDSTVVTDTLTPTHVYEQNGVFNVTLTVTDDDGGIGADILTVTVTNVSPVVGTIADQTVADGTELVLSATFTDPGQDTQMVVIDWGDGSSDTQTIHPEAGGSISALHTFADDGVFTVTLTVTDESGGTDTEIFTVTVDNVVPVAEAGTDQIAAEGSPVSFTGSFADPGHDTHTIAWDFGDGTVVTDILNPTHIYEQDGVFTVTLTVTDDDGAVGTDTVTVTVVNVDPVIDAMADQTVPDGSEFVLAATFNDPGNDTQTVVINWGDGSPADAQTVGPEAGGSISATHLYADDGVFTVTVTVTDPSGGTDTQSFTLTVDNVAPVAEAGADQTVAEGSPVSFAGSFADPGTDTHNIRWDFGNGAVVTDTLDPAHIYNQNGTFTVTLTVTDDDGGVGTDTLTVTVTNVSPIVDAIPDQTVADGSTFVLAATFNDPGHDTQTVVIVWGDGSPADTQTVGPEADGHIAATHAYADDGIFAVTMTVTDESGGTDIQTFTVTVVNVVPVADAGADQQVTEGDWVALSGSFSDPGTDTHLILWDFGDGTIQSDSSTLSATHRYVQDGTYTVAFMVTDDDGAVGTDTLVITVSNAPPVVEAGPDQTVDAGATLTLAPATFTDPGLLDAHSAEVDWGDGTVEPGGILAASGVNDVLGSHIYTVAGVYLVTVTVTDDADARGTDTFTATVLQVNHPPVASAGANQTVHEGNLVNLDGSGSQDPDGDPLTYTWTQVAGPTVSLMLTDPVRPTFTAPSVPADGLTLTFALVVSDGDVDSETSVVNITVKNMNNPPQADAGATQTVQEQSIVTLDGTGSFDPDGELLTFLWQQTDGPAVTLSDPEAAQPTFTAPQVSGAGETLHFSLRVSDGVDTAIATTEVQVSNTNQAPIGDAGAAQTVEERSLVQLDGQGSSDPDGDALSYTWSQLTGPVVALSDGTATQPTFTAPLVAPGGVTLEFELITHDGLLASAPSQVVITVLNINDPPACELAQASPVRLWPPNHKLVEVVIGNITDPDNEAVQVRVTGITQDEPLNGLGDGDTSPDATVQNNTLLLRSERSGGGNGRVYTLHFQADDGFHSPCTGTVVVCVPKNKKGTCVDDGQVYDALQP